MLQLINDVCNGQGCKSFVMHATYLSSLFNVYAMKARATSINEYFFQNISLNNIDTRSYLEYALVLWNRTIYNFFFTSFLGD